MALCANCFQSIHQVDGVWVHGDGLAAEPAAPTPTPEQGKLFRYRGGDDTGGFPQTVVVTYVSETRRPVAGGACNPPDDDHPAEGWYIEFRYPHVNSGHYRTFVAFDRALADG